MGWGGGEQHILVQSLDQETNDGTVHMSPSHDPLAHSGRTGAGSRRDKN